MNLSPMEKAIYDAILMDRSKLWTIDEIASVAYKQKERPVHWYGTLAATMRTLILKSRLLQIKIVRTSQLGRGGKAEYTCETGLGVENV